MYELSVESWFSSAHHLREYDGKCRRLHGHNWKVVLVVRATSLDNRGMAVDFHTLKDLLKEATFEMDHVNLNDLAAFSKLNPTAENIARYLFDKLLNNVDATGARLHKILVWESDSSSASYVREQ